MAGGNLPTCPLKSGERSEPTSPPAAEGGPLEAPPEGPPEAPSEYPAEKIRYLASFCTKKVGQKAKFRTGLYKETGDLKIKIKVVVSVCKGINRYARNMDTPSRFGDPSLSSYLCILVRQAITLQLLFSH